MIEIWIGRSFLAVWAGWIVYWIASAHGNKPTVTRANPAWRIAALVLLAFAYFGARAHPQVFQRRLLPASVPRESIGLALTIAGAAFSIWARRTLGTNWSANPTIKQGHELITAGPYRYVRHPIYSGVLLAVFGACLAQARVFSAAVMAILVALLVVKLRIEETLMMRQFPEAYPNYRRTTKALIPFLL